MNINFNPEWIQAIVGIFTLLAAIYIGWKQNQINEKVGKLNDVVELHGALLIIESENIKKEKVLKQYICIQNIGTRIIYLQSYSFNGKKYQLHGHTLASTYSQTLANYYQIELPTNGENHVSLEVIYKDIDGRKWMSELFADYETNWGWKISPLPKKEIK